MRRQLHFVIGRSLSRPRRHIRVPRVLIAISWEVFVGP